MDFNPRPLAGATPGYGPVPGRRHDFNPRPLAGATGPIVVHFVVHIISIHAPLRGRPIEMHPVKESTLFQSTPPCGGDWTHRLPLTQEQDFNPRPLAGATG